MALNKHTSECIFLQHNISDWVPLGPGQMASQVTQVAWDLHQLVLPLIELKFAHTNWCTVFTIWPPNASQHKLSTRIFATCTNL